MLAQAEQQLTAAANCRLSYRRVVSTLACCLTATVAATTADRAGAQAARSPSVHARVAASQVHVTAETRTEPRVVELTISTPAFSTPTHVDVDVPVGYWTHEHRRWPVAYFLAGTMNTYASFNDVVDGVKLTRHFPAIIVSPNGDSGYWSDWYNSGAYGPPKYETFVIKQLIPLIDKRFRTVPIRSQRAIAGVSMGGYGAMMLAARHPGLFGEAASISGAVDSNPAPLAAALSASPTFQGAPPDAIYGPKATEEVRWHGHNPTDLADNLRGIQLQVRTANGIPDPAIGENELSADSASCVVEGGVHLASVDFNKALNRLHIQHLWRDYGPGCHTAPNFEREITATIKVFATQFRHPKPRPTTFNYESIQPAFHVYGWSIRADRKRALEFLRLKDVRSRRITVTGSGLTAVTTPPRFRGVKRVGLTGATRKTAVPDAAGRVTFLVDLGPPDTDQQYTAGATTRVSRRTVTITRVDHGPTATRRTATSPGGSA